MKRVVIIYTIFALCIWGLNLRLAQLSEGDAAAGYVANSTRTITAAESRGYFYDRNYVPLVNAAAVHMAAVLPDEETIDSLADNTDREALDLMEKGKPCLITVNKRRVSTDHVRYFDVTSRYSSGESLAHTIGYLGADGTGVFGLEKSFNQLLSECSGQLRVRFETDGKGQALPGSKITLIDENYDSKGGVRLTIDAGIQKICEDAAKKYLLDCGAIAVLDCKTSQILAKASFPTFDPADIAASLSAEDAPFMDRVLTAYAVGSVFKVVTAAAALETGIDTDYSYECKGYIEIGSIRFHCHNREGHGLMDMKSAMEQSCNPYFISLAQQTGGEVLLSMAKALGLGEEIELADGMISAAGSLPAQEQLQNAGDVANFAFGQGSFSATPLQMAAVYACIANGGVYHEPYLLLEQINNNGDSFAEFIPDAGVRVMSSETAATLQELLKSTVDQGSGQAAKPANGTAAGKTATAQSGVFEDGEEVLRTWFCGYFPAEKPQYTVVVMKEDGESPIVDCAPIFREIAEQLLPDNTEQMTLPEEEGTTAP